LADHGCMIVIAPLFDQQRFPGWTYQLGGIIHRGVVRGERSWTVNLVLDIVDWARRTTQVQDYSLIGHSAGGQFLSRVAAFLPTEAKRIVIANPSTYVLPSTSTRAPYGLGLAYSGSTATHALRRYLEQPVTILLGEEDNDEESKELAKTPEAMKQGNTRLERGLNTFRAAERIAAKRGWTLNWRLIQVAGVGHNARRMFSSPEAEEALSPSAAPAPR
jgi:pimeloyl-ACP methyl ester carboxylesterase